MRYRQFGGLKLIVEYAKFRALWPTIRACFSCLVRGYSFKQIYPDLLKRVEPLLVARYEEFMRSLISKVKDNNLEHKRSKILWFCWLQGLEQAPSVVKACYNSLKRNLPYREVKVIDNENWKEYVELPEYIVKKWEQGRIPAALFSDLLRLELLIKYGGTWIDSTVLCTGLNENHNENDNKSRIVELENKAKQYLDADLFLFQYTKQGSIPISISNWFITACSNNEVLMVLRELLYAYWRDYDCTLDYYIFHLFFSLLSKEYPDTIIDMPYGQSMNSLALLHHWGEKFDLIKWEKLTSKVSFHKLAFRVDENVKNNKGNYYNYILMEYGSI